MYKVPSTELLVQLVKAVLVHQTPIQTPISKYDDDDDEMMMMMTRG